MTSMLYISTMRPRIKSYLFQNETLFCLLAEYDNCKNKTSYAQKEGHFTDGVGL